MDENTRLFSRAVRNLIHGIMTKTRCHLREQEVQRLTEICHIMAPATWTQRDTEAHIKMLGYRIAEELDIPPWA